jgi:hypothetical protein
MELNPSEWQLVSDPFEPLRIFRSRIPFIAEEGAGSIHLLLAEDSGHPPVLLACHDFQALGIFDAEIRLLHDGTILNLGTCSRMGRVDKEGFWEPPRNRHPLAITPEIMTFLQAPRKEVSYRLKHTFYTYRGTILPEGLEALGKAVKIVSP